MMVLVSRYITMEELEQALREFGMNDGRDIKEIISEVDGDNVRKTLFTNFDNFDEHSTINIYKRNISFV